MQTQSDSEKANDPTACISVKDQRGAEIRRQMAHFGVGGTMRREWIYALEDSQSGVVRYVGRTYEPLSRFNFHVSMGRKAIATGEGTPVARWIAVLIVAGELPNMRILAGMASPYRSVGLNHLSKVAERQAIKGIAAELRMQKLPKLLNVNDLPKE